jgi:NTE family protein
MIVLRELIGEADIEQLPIAFTAVAMELESGKEIWMRKGKLFDAIRASIAIPLLLTPASRDGYQLVDGGLVNPVPIAPTLNDRTELTIAVNVGGRDAQEPPPPVVKAVNGEGYRQRIRAFIESLQQPSVPAAPGMIDVALRSMEAMENTIARLKLAAYSPDVTIEIPRNACQIHEFWRAEEMIALGRERAAMAFAAREK